MISANYIPEQASQLIYQFSKKGTPYGSASSDNAGYMTEYRYVGLKPNRIIACSSKYDYLYGVYLK